MRFKGFIGLALAAMMFSGCVSANRLAFDDQSYYYRQAAVSYAVQAAVLGYQAYLNVQMARAQEIRNDVERRFQACVAHTNTPVGYENCRVIAINAVVPPKYQRR